MDGRCFWEIVISAKFFIPAGNYMFKVKYRNTRTSCPICSKLTIKVPERRQWCWAGKCRLGCFWTIKKITEKNLNDLHTSFECLFVVTINFLKIDSIKYIATEVFVNSMGKIVLSNCMRKEFGSCVEEWRGFSSNKLLQ